MVKERRVGAGREVQKKKNRVTIIHDIRNTFTFTIIQAFPLYKAYMLRFGQVRKGS